MNMQNLEKTIGCPAVLLIIFNRPGLTQKVFTRIREAKPTELFIAADGPRPDHPGEKQICDEARRVVDQVDWPCKVKTLLREQNLGCRYGPSSGITWFFENVEAGIILEDDCLPDLSFFPFCFELLARYNNDSRIGMISGNNLGTKLYDGNLSYSFSRHGLTWGWATWKRAWDEYLIDNRQLSAIEIDLIKSNISQNRHFTDYWWRGADTALRGDLSIWDYLWGVTRYRNNYLVIRPKVNLVANIGFGTDATHTTGLANELYVSSESIKFPLTHPNIMVPDKIADDALELYRAGKPFSWLQRTKNIMQRIRLYVGKS
jgi:hypothetical protein